MSKDSVLATFVGELETELRAYIDAERERIETERDFLLNVLEGRTDGVTVEDVSSALVASYLSDGLGAYISIEADDP